MRQKGQAKKMNTKSEKPGSMESDSDDEPLAKMVAKSTSKESHLPTSVHEEATNDTNSSLQRPLTAFAHFFNDTQLSIRQKNEVASFEEVSQIVTVMWQNLDDGARQVYIKREEESRRDFLTANSESDETPMETDSTSPEAVWTSETEKTIDAEQTNGEGSAKLSHPFKTHPVKAIGSETQTIPATKPDRLAEALASPLGERAPIAQGISLLKQRTPKVFVLSNQNSLAQTQSVEVSSSAAGQWPVTLTVVGQGIQSAKSPVFISKGENGAVLIKSAVIKTDSGKTITPITLPVTSQGDGKMESIITDGKNAEDSVPAKTKGTKICKRKACNNMAVKHPKWDEDYCSSLCVVQHVETVFQDWISTRKS